MRCLTAIAAIAVGASPAPAFATWSIVAVDPRTGEVGSAGASCTPFVAGIARLVPGRGAVVAQAASNMAAKAKAAALIEAGRSAEMIIAAITAPGFDRSFAEQQYGVAVIGPHRRAQAAAFTGSTTAIARGHRVGATYAVQGNILASDQVLDAVDAAMRGGPTLPLPERLMRALEAGSRTGGDRRCPGRTAQSAYLGVAKPGDSPAHPSIRIVVGLDDDDSRNPVTEVGRRFDQIRRAAD